MQTPTLMKPGYDWRNPTIDPRLDRASWPFQCFVDGVNGGPGDFVETALATPEQLARVSGSREVIGMHVNLENSCVTDPMYLASLDSWLKTHPDAPRPIEPEPVLYDGVAAMKRIEVKLDKVIKHFGL